ncbi:MAG: DUF1697 domain-containing protein [Gammaproteobacteria bacterium]
MTTQPTARGPAQRYVALLRGINVGRAKRVAMADLRRVFGQLGYTDVHSVQGTGNLVFTCTETPATAERRIGEGIVLKLGVAARVTVLTTAELDELIEQCPLVAHAADPARLLGCIVSDASRLALLQSLAEQDWAPEAFALGKRSAWLWCPDGILESRAAAQLGKLLGDGFTARNWPTLLRLQKLCAQ